MSSSSDTEEEYHINPKTGNRFYHLRWQPGTEYFASGLSGQIRSVPDDPSQLHKVPVLSKLGKQLMKREKLVYARIGRHPNIINCIAIEDWGIRLEKAEHRSIREYYLNDGTATLAERIKWSRNVAEVSIRIHVTELVDDVLTSLGIAASPRSRRPALGPERQKHPPRFESQRPAL